MHHGTCITHVPWCMRGSLTSGFLWSRWWEKHSRHSRCMCNPQFYVSSKRSYWHKATIIHPLQLCSNTHSIINHCRLCLVLLVVYITNANLTNLIHYFPRHIYYCRTNHFTQNQYFENLSEIFTRHIKYYRCEEKTPSITNTKANCRDLRSAVRNICVAGFVHVIQKL